MLEHTSDTRQCASSDETRKSKHCLSYSFVCGYNSSVFYSKGKFHMDDGSKASRKTIMKVLGNVKELLIRATFANNTKITM